MTEETTKLALFENKAIRREWNAQEQEWYWSVVDVCGAMTDQPTQDRARNYWKVLKNRLNEEGSELVTNCNQLKMVAEDDKMRNTDVLNTKGILRLIQSIPSKKAEPFKMWLATIGNERLNEIADPELAINRAILTYKKKGYSDEWIKERMRSKEIRDELVKEWTNHGIEKPIEIAMLTDEILRTWSGKSTQEYKDYKNLKKENLRDNMSRMELLLTMLGEEATKDLTQEHNPLGFTQNKDIAHQGGSVAYAARKQYEDRLGRPVVSELNFKEAKEQGLLDQVKKQGEES